MTMMSTVLMFIVVTLSSLESLTPSTCGGVSTNGHRALERRSRPVSMALRSEQTGGSDQTRQMRPRNFLDARVEASICSYLHA